MGPLTRMGRQQSAQTTGRALAKLVDRLRSRGIQNEKVLEAMTRVPRHHFVEQALQYSAYDDTALPIGFQQTISQPYVVARMIEILLHGRKSLGHTLEVGAGCGYQAAVLSYLAQEVYALERIRPLLDKARENLRPLRLPNVRLKYTDGNMGLEEVAPFDTIIVAAAARQLPESLLHQLAYDGRLLIPLETAGGQRLILIERHGEKYIQNQYDAVKFVPLLPGTE